MRGEVISVLSLERRYHILSRVSVANEESRAKTRLYFQIIYTLSTFQNEVKMIV